MVRTVSMKPEISAA